MLLKEPSNNVMSQIGGVISEHKCCLEDGFVHQLESSAHALKPQVQVNDAVSESLAAHGHAHDEVNLRVLMA